MLSATRSPTSSTGSATPVDGSAGSTRVSSAAPNEPTAGTAVLDSPKTKVAIVPTRTTVAVRSTASGAFVGDVELGHR